jgi:hypothetical protein
MTTTSLLSGKLPNGLTLVFSTGLTSGTSTLAGPFGFVIKVSDSASYSATSNSCTATLPWVAKRVALKLRHHRTQQQWTRANILSQSGHPASFIGSELGPSIS